MTPGFSAYAMMLCGRHAARAMALFLLSMPYAQPVLPPPVQLHASASGTGIDSSIRRHNPFSELCRPARLARGLATVVAPSSPNLGSFQSGITKLNQVIVGISDRVWSARHQLLAGAMGRCVAVSMMFPIDTVKTRLQMFGRDCCTVCPRQTYAQYVS